MLEELSNTVNDLKASLDFSDSMVETLKSDNASLRTEVIRLTRLTDELVLDHNKMGNIVLDLQSRSMRDNIIFHGIPELKNETHHRPEELVKTFLVQNLKMRTDEAAAIDFSRVHRLGKSKTDANGKAKSRPIVANVTNSKMKYSIMSKGKALKNTTYSISDQFPPEIMDRRRLLYPIMTEARKKKQKARLSVDKLYINDELYRNSEITYWLSGGGDDSSLQETSEAQPSVLPEVVQNQQHDSIVDVNMDP